MLPLLRAELGSRLGAFGRACALLLTALASLLLITEPGVPVLSWGVPATVLLPLLISATWGVRESQERLCRQVVLPLPLGHVAKVRLSVPIILQLLAGVVAAGLAMGDRLLGRGPGAWGSLAWMTCVLLLLEQWLVLQRELLLPSAGRAGRAWIAAPIATAAVALPLAVGLPLARILRDQLVTDPLATRWLLHLPYQIVILLLTAALFKVNLQLFLRRDATAE